MSGSLFVLALSSNMINSQAQRAVELGSAAVNKLCAIKSEPDPTTKAILRHEYQLIMMQLEVLSIVSENNRKMIAALCGEPA